MEEIKTPLKNHKTHISSLALKPFVSQRIAIFLSQDKSNHSHSYRVGFFSSLMMGTSSNLGVDVVSQP
jgi:hypothetical protein